MRMDIKSIMTIVTPEILLRRIVECVDVLFTIGTMVIISFFRLVLLDMVIEELKKMDACVIHVDKLVSLVIWLWLRCFMTFTCDPVLFIGQKMLLEQGHEERL